MTRKQRRTQARTQTRAEAARANGANSHGPTTPQGKAKSAQNGLRHGAFAKTTLLDTESPEALDCLVNDYIRDYQPQNPSQLKIIYRMASATWRQQRAQGIEAAMVNDKMQEQYLAIAERNPGRDIDAATRAGLAEFEMYGPNSRLKAIQNAADLCERQFSRALRDLERAKKTNTEPNSPILDEHAEPEPEPHQPESHQPEPEKREPEPAPAQSVKASEAIAENSARPATVETTAPVKSPHEVIGDVLDQVMARREARLKNE